MHPILFGDYDLAVLYRQFSGNQFCFQDIIREEFRLTNLYLTAIKDGAKILRIPTQTCLSSHLTLEKLDDRIESIANLCVSNAKKAIENTGSEVLLAGTIGSVLDFNNREESDVAKELAELIIYLADFGVDIFVVQGVSDWEQFSMIITLIRKLSGAPIAPFFPSKSFNVSFLNNYEELCKNFQLELAGFEFELDEKTIENLIVPNIDAPIGLMISNPEATMEPPLELTRRLIEKVNPTVVLGGANISRRNWLEIQPLFNGTTL